MSDIYDFVMTINAVFGSCGFTCDICGTEYKACDGEYADENGDCPDNTDSCPSGSFDFTRYTENGDKQVCEHCFEKVFGNFKQQIDLRRSEILMYYAGQIKEERKSLKYEEKLLREASK